MPRLDCHSDPEPCEREESAVACGRGDADFEWNWRRLLLLLLLLAALSELVLNGILPAFHSGKNDFSDPFVGARLWRQGQNPWDGALMNATARRLGIASSPVNPIYPLTTYVLVVPFSFVPWKWANLFWVTLSVLAAGVIPWALLRIGEFRVREERAWLLVSLSMAFPPLHRAIHLGNPAVIAVALCLIGIYFAKQNQDVASGIMLAAATGLKPQLGFWILLFYLLRGRWRLAGSALLGLLALAAAALSQLATHLPEVIATYREDLRYSFGVGGSADFSVANPLRFQLVNAQVILWQIVHARGLADVLAFSLFAIGLGALAYAVFRTGVHSEPLVLTALVGLSFVATYHSVTDITFFVLVLCWVLNDSPPGLRRMKGVVLFSFLLLFLPVHSFLVRIEPHLGPGVLASSSWNLLIGPSFIWLLLFFNVVVLAAVAMSSGLARTASHDPMPASR